MTPSAWSTGKGSWGLEGTRGQFYHKKATQKAMPSQDIAQIRFQNFSKSSFLMDYGEIPNYKHSFLRDYWEILKVSRLTKLL